MIYFRVRHISRISILAFSNVKIPINNIVQSIR